MSAYFLFDNLKVTDPAKLEQYKEEVAPVVERFGGRYKTVGGPIEIYEGDWRPAFPVIIEFDTADQAREWYGSADYKDLKALRQSAVRCNAVLIEGF